MSSFWHYQFEDSIDQVQTFDEAPLWSAAFGLLLLEHLELKEDKFILDLGSGAGFPLLELAERMGSNCQCYGVDPWINANIRAQLKMKNYNVSNVEIKEERGEKMSFEDSSLDLIVSNLGINNFENKDQVLAECSRILRSEGRIALTTNLNGHWKEFYFIFEEILNEKGKILELNKLKNQQNHRGSPESIIKIFESSNFKLIKRVDKLMPMQFYNGSAFLNHHFVKLGWLSSWKEIISESDWEMIFTELEDRLNAESQKKGNLTLTVPMGYFEFSKI